ncbi:hypothetical protein [Desulfovirgula thermocuniculi]|uniref:hypothetical protein n=1 Tax=Desulfovirgula thermocuniculi TaxID=348842 RepID=UPI0012ECACA5|nr:hypothetical protein [Desulfovirgula thermocuniculi]
MDGGRARIVTAVETMPGEVAEYQILLALSGKHIFGTRSRPDEERDVYICPARKTLYRTKEQPDGLVVYRVHRLACKGCPHQGTLCLNLKPKSTYYLLKIRKALKNQRSIWKRIAKSCDF